jgi:hypothetical protein
MSNKPVVATVGGWPKRMKAPKFCDYMREVHGIDWEPKTLANRRAARLPPHCQYLGATPVYTPEEGDRFAREDAFTSESPHARAAQRRKAAGLPPPAGIGRPRTKDRRAKPKAARARPPPAAE